MTSINEARHEIHKPLPDLRRTLLAAFPEMEWLTEADEPIKVLALKYAEAIEVRDENSPPISALGAQLLAVLREIGATPTARKTLNVEHNVSGRLAEIRDRSRKRDAASMDSA